MAVATFAGADRHGAAVAAFSGAPGRGRRRHRRVVVLRPAGAGRLDGRPDSARIPVAHAAGSRAGRAVGAGRARDRADELHRNDRGGSRLCPSRTILRSMPNRELVATGAANLGGALFGAMPARRRHLADRGRARRGRAVAEGVAGDGGCRGGDDAAAGTGAGPDCRTPRWRRSSSSTRSG